MDKLKISRGNVATIFGVLAIAGIVGAGITIIIAVFSSGGMLVSGMSFDATTFRVMLIYPALFKWHIASTVAAIVGIAGYVVTGRGE